MYWHIFSWNTVYNSDCQCVPLFADFCHKVFYRNSLFSFHKTSPRYQVMYVDVQIGQGQSQGHKTRVMEKTAFGKFTSDYVCIPVYSFLLRSTFLAMVGRLSSWWALAFIMWPWTVTYDLDLWTWPSWCNVVYSWSDIPTPSTHTYLCSPLHFRFVNVVFPFVPPECQSTDGAAFAH